MGVIRILSGIQHVLYEEDVLDCLTMFKGDESRGRVFTEYCFKWAGVGLRYSLVRVNQYQVF